MTNKDQCDCIAACAFAEGVLEGLSKHAALTAHEKEASAAAMRRVQAVREMIHLEPSKT